MNTEENIIEYKSYSRYIVGFILSLVIAAVAFSVVMDGEYSKQVMIWTIVIMAVAKIFVHLKFYLHLGFKTEDGKINTIAFLFTSLIIVMIVVLSLWVLFSANAMMMY